ncbi:MAG TPA: glycosyltransferase family 9 protein [Thermoleophilaceae bacterium]|nr:glycosyltransferase family 9 protein [Thermoleophilaceae bacterium]
MKPHVLVARLDSAGDVLLAGPAIRAVAAGARRVTLLCGPRGRAAAELLPGVDELLVHHAPWIDPEPDPISRAACEELVADVAARGPEQAIVLTSFHQSPLPLALLLRLAGVATIAAISVDYPGSLLDVRHHAPEEVHEVERSLSLVGTLGYELPADDHGGLAVLRDPSAVPASLAEWVEGTAPARGGYVVVHPGASVPARAWEPESCAALVADLAASGRRVAVTGGPDESALTGMVAGDRRPEVLDLGGTTGLAGLAEVLAGADAVVVGNTGPAHLAACVGTPVVSLYAPTVPAVRWRPWKVPHEILHVDVPCAGCRARECPVPGHPCLAGVSVEEARQAVERLATGSDGAVPTPEAVVA